MGLFERGRILMKKYLYEFKCYGAQKLMKEFPASGGRRPHTHTHTHLTALFQDYPSEPVPER